ncbi:hypothetical protein BC829DRAFT_412566 [Chytridium lagenaria]|nr:hypothetical protein BC829DRAFT_412566 [Chytridium lagenaria]
MYVGPWGGKAFSQDVTLPLPAHSATTETLRYLNMILFMILFAARLLSVLAAFGGIRAYPLPLPAHSSTTETLRYLNMMLSPENMFLGASTSGVYARVLACTCLRIVSHWLLCCFRPVQVKWFLLGSDILLDLLSVSGSRRQHLVRAYPLPLPAHSSTTETLRYLNMMNCVPLASVLFFRPVQVKWFLLGSDILLDLLSVSGSRRQRLVRAYPLPLPAHSSTTETLRYLNMMLSPENMFLGAFNVGRLRQGVSLHVFESSGFFWDLIFCSTFSLCIRQSAAAFSQGVSSSVARAFVDDETLRYLNMMLSPENMFLGASTSGVYARVLACTCLRIVSHWLLDLIFCSTFSLYPAVGGRRNPLPLPAHSSTTETLRYLNMMLSPENMFLGASTSGVYARVLACTCLRIVSHWLLCFFPALCKSSSFLRGWSKSRWCSGSYLLHNLLSVLVAFGGSEPVAATSCCGVNFTTVTIRRLSVVFSQGVSSSVARAFVDDGDTAMFEHDGSRWSKSRWCSGSYSLHDLLSVLVAFGGSEPVVATSCCGVNFTTVTIRRLSVVFSQGVSSSVARAFVDDGDTAMFEHDVFPIGFCVVSACASQVLSSGGGVKADGARILFAARPSLCSCGIWRQLSVVFSQGVSSSVARAFVDDGDTAMFEHDGSSSAFFRRWSKSRWCSGSYSLHDLLSVLVAFGGSEPVAATSCCGVNFTTVTIRRLSVVFSQGVSSSVARAFLDDGDTAIFDYDDSLSPENVFLGTSMSGVYARVLACTCLRSYSLHDLLSVLVAFGGIEPVAATSCCGVNFTTVTICRLINVGRLRQGVSLHVFENCFPLASVLFPALCKSSGCFRECSSESRWCNGMIRRENVIAVDLSVDLSIFLADVMDGWTDGLIDG